VLQVDEERLLTWAVLTRMTGEMLSQTRQFCNMMILNVLPLGTPSVPKQIIPLMETC
jgi:hypothetical protein